MMPGLQVPVLLLGYNRPDLMTGLIQVLRKVRPLNVYVSLDGPRSHKPGDHERCQATRDVIASQIDWPCQLHINASPVNLGCRIGVSSGITWFFQHVSEGIILEDDCWPAEDFFVFCETMLARYRNDSRVAMISGDNFQQGQKRPKASYYFSKYTHIWGWATWRRAWQNYDLEMKGLEDFFTSETWRSYQTSERETRHWNSLMTRVQNGEIDTWDYQWNYAVWKSGALVVLPAVNLVANEGFRADATHTVSENSPNAKLPTEPLGPLKFLSDVMLNVKADLFSFENLFSPPKNVSTQSQAKLAAKRETVAVKEEKKLQRAADDLATVKSSLSWRLFGKHAFSVEKRLRRLFGA